MYNDKIASFIVNKRLILGILLILMTVFFCYKLTSVKLATDLGDLLPQKHPYVKLHNSFRAIFGGANIIFIDVEVKEGDIFNEKTLKKISRISDSAMYIPGADRYKVTSIAQAKVKDFRASDWGLEVKPLMWPDTPKNEQAMEYLKTAIYSNDMIFGSLVSLDSKSALISLQFYEDRPLDYSAIFEKVREIAYAEKDDNTNIYIAGETMIKGYIYSFLGQTKMIFGVTLIAVLILLFVYTRSVQMVLLPLLSALFSAIWGLGLVGLLGYNLDPLALVVPLLITARTISHSVQFNERFIEEKSVLKDVKLSAHATIKALFFPGFAGILTDAAGIAVLAVIPIPMLQKLGVISAFWALTTVFTVLLMNPLALIYLPLPETSEGKDKEAGLFYRLLKRLSLLNKGKGAWVVILIALVIGVVAYFYAERIKVGDANPGSPILWPDSQYNIDAKVINESFQGLNPMLAVIDGEEGEKTLYDFENLHKMEEYQRNLEKMNQVGGTISSVNLVKKVNMNLHEGLPKWNIVPHSRNEIAVLFYMFMSSAIRGDLDPYATPDYKAGSITAYFKDHKGDTLREAMDVSQKFIDANPLEKAKFKMAAGVVGTLAAANEEVFKSQLALLVMTFAITIFLCSLTYRSLVAGLILAVPLAVSNYLIFAYMGLKGIGLNINTLPVATIAVGIGVDYGIYFLSRMKEEYSSSKDLSTANFVTLVTTGKAITFTALTVALGVVFWGFSDIKFQADMGLLLTIVTFFHLLGTLVLLPALILIIKPKFITNQ